ncbi:VOC family protein, partial [Candidatus Poribacteria bacterium]|nr:VOC family protein [Candidatus Poribacteria bacterium]
MNASIKIDHVAVMVSDLEKSLHFYRDLLGLEVVSPEEHSDGPISEMVAIPKVHMREYRLRAPGGIHGHTRNDGPGFTLDLIQWLNPTSPVER